MVKYNTLIVQQRAHWIQLSNGFCQCRSTMNYPKYREICGRGPAQGALHVGNTTGQGGLRKLLDLVFTSLGGSLV